MAIISSILGLRVSINVDKKAATEYDDPDDVVQETMGLDDFDVPPDHSQPPPHEIKYIEAQPGLSYSFEISKGPTFNKRSHHVAVQLSIDGEDFGLGHQKKGESVLTYDSTGSGNPTDGYRMHHFTFAPVDIVETDAIPTRDLQRQLAMANNCGVLKVALFHMRKSKRVREPVHYGPHDSLGEGTSGGEPIAEKALKGKAVDCRTTYTAAPNPHIKAPRRYKAKYSDRRERPFAVFEFRYRSKEGLIKEGIIPRPSVRQEVESMTEDEVRRRLAELMEQNQRPADNDEGAKREGGTRGAKREAPATGKDESLTRYKTRRLDNGKVEVDLT